MFDEEFSFTFKIDYNAQNNSISMLFKPQIESKIFKKMIVGYRFKGPQVKFEGKSILVCSWTG